VFGRSFEAVETRSSCRQAGRAYQECLCESGAQ
jgi:hypothetical protein